MALGLWIYFNIILYIPPLKSGAANTTGSPENNKNYEKNIT